MGRDRKGRVTFRNRLGGLGERCEIPAGSEAKTRPKTDIAFQASQHASRSDVSNIGDRVCGLCLLSLSPSEYAPYMRQWRNFNFGPPAENRT